VVVAVILSQGLISEACGCWNMERSFGSADQPDSRLLTALLYAGAAVNKDESANLEMPALFPNGP
jgi:hypothetical protein